MASSLPSSLLSMPFNFEELGKSHSGTSQMFLNSLGQLFSVGPGAEKSVDYFRSNEWQTMFPTLLESLDRFDRFSTNPDRVLQTQSLPLYTETSIPLSPIDATSPSPSASTASSPSSSSSSSSSSSTSSLASSEPPSVLSPSRNPDSPSTTSRAFAQLYAGESASSASPGGGDGDEVDITPFLCMPQFQASQMLRIRASTLSKRWKDATNNRKWPFRTLKRLDREITTLLKNIQLDPTSPKLIEQLGKLLRDREDQLIPVRISLQG